MKMSNNKKSKNFELGAIWMSYHNELNYLRKLVSYEVDNNWNRTFVRTLVSMIEGISYQVRQHLLKKYEDNLIELSAEEIILLKEKTVEIKNNGEIRLKDRFYAFEPIFNFTYKLYAQKHQKDLLSTDASYNESVKQLLEVIKVRNRITHPKNGKDVFVLGAETRLADETFSWYHNFVFELFDGDILE